MSDTTRPLGPLVLVIAAVMVGFAVFWVGFMLAPAAVILVAYLALSAGDRARRQRGGARAAAGEEDAGTPTLRVAAAPDAGIAKAHTGAAPQAASERAAEPPRDAEPVGAGTGMRSKGART